MVQRMLFGNRIRHGMSRIEDFICGKIPNLFTHRFLELIFPNLRINVKIRLANDIRHTRLNNFKAIIFQIFLNIMVCARMEIEQIFAYNENRWSAFTTIIRYIAHDVNRAFESAAHTENAAVLHAVDHGIHRPLKGGIGTACNQLIRAHLAQQFFQNVNHWQGKRNIECRHQAHAEARMHVMAVLVIIGQNRNIRKARIV